MLMVQYKFTRRYYYYCCCYYYYYYYYYYHFKTKFTFILMQFNSNNDKKYPIKDGDPQLGRHL